MIYFAVWIALAFFLNKWSLAQDRTADNRYTKNMRLLSGPGMVLLIFTVTFASVDWYMSLEPEWFSTIYGFIWVAAWSFERARVCDCSDGESLERRTDEANRRAAAFPRSRKTAAGARDAVVLFCFFAVSDHLVGKSSGRDWLLHSSHTWRLGRCDRHDRDTPFWQRRFLFLLSRNFKRNPRKLVLVAVLILLMRMVDLLWMLVPAFKEEHRWIWMDVIALIGFGGVWLALFTWQLSKRPLIPINDPQFESVMEQMHAGGH